MMTGSLKNQTVLLDGGQTRSEMRTYFIDIIDILSGRNGLSIFFPFLRVDIPRVELREAERFSHP